MNLPRASRAQVDRAKVVEYLLNSAHPDGASKARFFLGFGFRFEHPDGLMGALRRHGSAHPVSSVVETRFGNRYTVDGDLESPDGRNPMVRTVWMVEEKDDAPRLITAYPLMEKRGVQ
jgi:hypothetical protein